MSGRDLFGLFLIDSLVMATVVAGWGDNSSRTAWLGNEFSPVKQGMTASECVQPVTNTSPRQE